MLYCEVSEFIEPVGFKAKFPSGGTNDTRTLLPLTRNLSSGSRKKEQYSTNTGTHKYASLEGDFTLSSAKEPNVERDTVGGGNSWHRIQERPSSPTAGKSRRQLRTPETRSRPPPGILVTTRMTMGLKPPDPSLGPRPPLLSWARRPGRELAIAVLEN